MVTAAFVAILFFLPALLLLASIFRLFRWVPIVAMLYAIAHATIALSS
jgi:hypothetical protein